MTITLIKKGVHVPVKAFDPSLRKGYDTFIVNKVTQARFKVLKHWPLTGEILLVNETGARITSHIRPGFGFKYEVVRVKKARQTILQ